MSLRSFFAILHGKRPFVVKQEFEPSQTELGGNDIKIERKPADRYREMHVDAFEQSEGDRRQPPHASNSNKVPRERVALAGVRSKIDKIIPEKKERGADGKTACGDREDWHPGVVGFEIFEWRRYQEIINASPRKEPPHAGAERLLPD